MELNLRSGLLIMIVSAARISRVLKEHPEGLNANQIANIIKVDAESIESVLLMNENTHFVKSVNGVWRNKSNPYSLKPEFSDDKQTLNRGYRNNQTHLPNRVNATYGIKSFGVAGCYYHKSNIDLVLNKTDLGTDSITRIAVLRKEPDNPYDSDAIKVMVLSESTKVFYCVGYVPKGQTAIYSPYVENFAHARISKNNDQYIINVSIIPNKERYEPYIEAAGDSNVDEIEKESVTGEKTPVQREKTPIPRRTSPVRQTINNKDPEKRILLKNTLKWIVGGSIAYAVFTGAPKLNIQKVKSIVSTAIADGAWEKKYTKRTYNVYGSYEVISNNHVGRDWKFDYVNVIVNGVDKGSDGIALTEGDKIEFSGRIYEDDSYPDIGDFSADTSKSYIVSSSDLQKGFDRIAAEVEVIETNGRYKGKKAKLKIIMRFAPQD